VASEPPVSPRFALVLPLVVALLALGAVIATVRLRRVEAPRWSPLMWALLVLGGLVSAVVVRAAETLLTDLALGQRLSGADWLRPIVAFGIVGPMTVLALVAVVWPTLTRGLTPDLDPPLAGATAAAGLVIGRILTALFVEHVALGSGVRAAIIALDDITIAATWGYGLALSAFDGTPGGTPFGRYAIGAMLLRGGVELAIRSPGGIGLSLALSVGGLALVFAGLGVYRLSRGGDEPPSSLASVGQETIREIARSELRRGGVRPLWILLGALANVGGILLGFASAVLVGRSARIDFGEIDRSGPGAEYAAMLLALGVIFSFPMTAAVVGIASGGRNLRDRAHVLEAGLSAIVALAACLAVLGVVAPVAFAVGLACAPVAFVLAGLGAWIAAGRRM
jgi:hypothetical protein